MRLLTSPRTECDMRLLTSPQTECDMRLVTSRTEVLPRGTRHLTNRNTATWSWSPHKQKYCHVELVTPRTEVLPLTRKDRPRPALEPSTRSYGQPAPVSRAPPGSRAGRPPQPSHRWDRGCQGESRSYRCHRRTPGHPRSRVSGRQSDQ